MLYKFKYMWRNVNISFWNVVYIYVYVKDLLKIG